MALTLGKDYAFAARVRDHFDVGHGSGPAVLTKNTLLVFPELAWAHRGGKRIRSTFTIGDQPPVDVIHSVLQDAATTPDSLEAKLKEWAKEVEGPVLEDMSKYPYFQIWTGWLRRSIVFSTEKPRMGIYEKRVLRPSKQEMPSWVDMLRDQPNLQLNESWI